MHLPLFNASTDASAKTQDPPTTHGDRRSVNAPSPAPESYGKQGKATPNKVENSESIRKQAASKHADNMSNKYYLRRLLYQIPAKSSAILN